jgi:hypothetical protein
MNSDASPEGVTAPQVSISQGGKRRMILGPSSQDVTMKTKLNVVKAQNERTDKN